MAATERPVIRSVQTFARSFGGNETFRPANASFRSAQSHLVQVKRGNETSFGPNETRSANSLVDDGGTTPIFSVTVFFNQDLVNTIERALKGALRNDNVHFKSYPG